MDGTVDPDVVRQNRSLEQPQEQTARGRDADARNREQAAAPVVAQTSVGWPTTSSPAVAASRSGPFQMHYDFV